MSYRVILPMGISQRDDRFGAGVSARARAIAVLPSRLLMIAAIVGSSALTAGNIKPIPTRAEEVADFLKARLRTFSQIQSWTKTRSSTVVHYTPWIVDWLRVVRPSWSRRSSSAPQVQD